MFQSFRRIQPIVRFFRAYSSKNVWVVTDGALESSLQALTLGKQLSPHVELKTVVASKKLQLFPPILQKYIVDWYANKPKKNGLPWYLSGDLKQEQDSLSPDYIITSGQDAVSACLYLSHLNKSSFTVYLGYPNIPFINFDQVVLPKYEANAKMAALGPLARQKNGIITPAPLLDLLPLDNKNKKSLVSFKQFSTVVIGGHSPNCRWYSEDAVTLAENIKRMVHHLNDHVVVVYTDRTPSLAKNKINERLAKLDSVYIWDSSTAATTMDKINTYETIIHDSSRVILTADLDYATAHAVSKNKPVYVAFSGQCRSYLNHFHRWLLDSHLSRKLRLDRTKSYKSQDPYSYLGVHQPWGNASSVLQIKQTMAFVKKEIEAIYQEKLTGKRRK